MIRPNLFIRITGNRFMGILFFSIAIPAIIGWREGMFSWVVALFAVALIVRVYRSMDVMHRYNRWAKEWDTLNDEPDGAEAQHDGGLRYD